MHNYRKLDVYPRARTFARNVYMLTAAVTRRRSGTLRRNYVARRSPSPLILPEQRCNPLIDEAAQIQRMLRGLIENFPP